jgi:hypothetical protein
MMEGVNSTMIYIVRTFVNVTMYTQYNNTIKKEKILIAGINGGMGYTFPLTIIITVWIKNNKIQSKGNGNEMKKRKRGSIHNKEKDSRTLALVSMYALKHRERNQNENSSTKSFLSLSIV